VHIVADPTAMHESQLLQLNSTKANDVLRWNIRWAFDDTMQRTVGWYRNLHDEARAIDLTDADVKAYLSA
jgi:CDP-glucose 4,6-dehydratase